VQRIEIPENYQQPIQGSQNKTKTTNEVAVLDNDWSRAGYQPKPGCKACGGAGFVYPRNDDGSINYSKPVPCKAKGCLYDSVLAYKMGSIRSNSGVRETKQCFETFDADVPGVKKAYQASWKIAEGTGDVNWLLIYGGVGNGKTHLLNSIANRVMDRGIPTRLVMMADLLAELRMSMDEHKADARLDELKRIPFLLIDELGLELGTDWEKSRIEELFASRWANARHTVVATNRDITELPQRLQSRFRDKHFGKAIMNEAADYRITRGKG